MSIPHGDITIFKQDMTALSGCPWCRGFMTVWCFSAFLCVMISVGDEEQKRNLQQVTSNERTHKKLHELWTSGFTQPHSPPAGTTMKVCSFMDAGGGGGGFPLL